MVMEDEDDGDLAFFIDLQSCQNGLLLHETDDFDYQLGAASKQDRSSISTVPPRRTGIDAFLNSENDKTDFDWLYTPPDTPLFPALEMEALNTSINQMRISNGHPTTAESRIEPASRNKEASKHSVLSGSNSSTSSTRRPSLSGGSTSTASTPVSPTGRAALPATTRPSRSSTSTMHSIFPATTKVTKPGRSLTPTSRAPVASSTKLTRSSTPTSRAKPARPSTPTSRASVSSTTKPSRTSTSTSRATLASTKTSVPVVRSSTPTRSSSVPKSVLKMVKNPVPSRGSSPTVKSRTWKPSEMPGFSNESPPNLKTTMPDRPASASRYRPGPPSARSSSNGRTRLQPSSPSRVRAPSKGYSVLAMSRGHSINNDDVNPVLMGTKMVERVVNMRKLPPPKQDDPVSNNSLGKSSTPQENFGRTLSKSSLDMAIRHMDITRRIPGNLRLLVRKVPASPVCSARSGSTKSSTISGSGSPITTSSDFSSEPSFSNGSSCLDGIEVEDNDFANETAGVFTC